MLNKLRTAGMVLLQVLRDTVDLHNAQSRYRPANGTFYYWFEVSVFGEPHMVEFQGQNLSQLLEPGHWSVYST